MNTKPKICLTMSLRADGMPVEEAASIVHQAMPLLGSALQSDERDAEVVLVPSMAHGRILPGEPMGLEALMQLDGNLVNALKALDDYVQDDIKSDPARAWLIRARDEVQGAMECHLNP